MQCVFINVSKDESRLPFSLSLTTIPPLIQVLLLLTICFLWWSPTKRTIVKTATTTQSTVQRRDDYDHGNDEQQPLQRWPWWWQRRLTINNHDLFKKRFEELLSTRSFDWSLKTSGGEIFKNLFFGLTIASFINYFLFLKWKNKVLVICYWNLNLVPNLGNFGKYINPQTFFTIHAACYIRTNWTRYKRTSYMQHSTKSDEIW